MMMALCQDSKKEFAKEGLAAAVEGAKLVADTLYTILMLSSGKATLEMMRSEISLADYTPASGTGFLWHKINYQGRIMPNASGSFGDASVPRKLYMVPLELKKPDGTVKEYKKGLGTGDRTEYTFLIPQEVFKKFSVDVGSHTEIGRDGIVGFEILLDGESVATTGDIKGTEPLKHLDIDLGKAKKLTLKTTRGKGEHSKIHAVWGNPTLKK